MVLADSVYVCMCVHLPPPHSPEQVDNYPPMCFYSPLLYPECGTSFDSLTAGVSLVNSTASRSSIQSECLDSFFAEEVRKRLLLLVFVFSLSLFAFNIFEEKSYLEIPIT